MGKERARRAEVLALADDLDQFACDHRAVIRMGGRARGYPDVQAHAGDLVDALFVVRDRVLKHDPTALDDTFGGLARDFAEAICHAKSLADVLDDDPKVLAWRQRAAREPRPGAESG